MKFTTPCFIRKNTPELRKKLEEIGYKDSLPSMPPLPEYADIVTMDNKYYQCTLDNYHAIDCGTNEALFLALAALREDSDEGQWFTNGDGLWYVCKWVQSECIRRDDRIHKASAPELIEHFIKNE